MPKLYATINLKQKVIMFRNHDLIAEDCNVLPTENTFFLAFKEIFTFGQWAILYSQHMLFMDW